MPGVHHERFHDHAGHPPGVLGEHALEHLQVVEGHDEREVDHGLRDPPAGGHRQRALARAELVDVAVHRDHHGVVVAVVAALDLDDEVAPGDGPHQVDGVHRGLGARVAEAPPGQPEAPAELLGHDHGVLGRLGEVRAELHPALDGRDDGGVRVADEHHAVAGVQVDVLGPVEVVDLRPLPVADPDGARAGDHPAGGGPTGERAPGPLPHRRRAWLAGEERVLLPGDQVGDRGPDTRGVSERCHRLVNPFGAGCGVATRPVSGVRPLDVRAERPGPVGPRDH